MKRDKRNMKQFGYEEDEWIGELEKTVAGGLLNWVKMNGCGQIRGGQEGK